MPSWAIRDRSAVLLNTSDLLLDALIEFEGLGNGLTDSPGPSSADSDQTSETTQLPKYVLLDVNRFNLSQRHFAHLSRYSE